MWSKIFERYTSGTTKECPAHAEWLAVVDERAFRALRPSEQIRGSHEAPAEKSASSMLF